MKKNIYEQKSVKELIFIFSMPAILSLIVETLTSVVDTAFAGHLGAESCNGANFTIALYFYSNANIVCNFYSYNDCKTFK